MVAFTPGTDFLTVVDGLEVVNVVTRAEASTPAQISTAVHAKRRLISIRERAASDGKYLSKDVRWHIHTSELATVAIGDRIIDAAGVVWVVQDVDQNSYQTRWMLPSRQLSIVAGLDQLVTIERLVWGQGYSGQAEPNWEPYKTVAAKLHIDSQSPTTENNQRYIRKAGKVFFAEPVGLADEFRVIYDGELYNVTGDEERDSLTDLYAVSVVSTPWPLGQ